MIAIFHPEAQDLGGEPIKKEGIISFKIGSGRMALERLKAVLKLRPERAIFLGMAIGIRDVSLGEIVLCSPIRAEQKLLHPDSRLLARVQKIGFRTAGSSSFGDARWETDSVIDSESYLVAEELTAQHIPFLVVRVVCALAGEQISSEQLQKRAAELGQKLREEFLIPFLGSTAL